LVGLSNLLLLLQKPKANQRAQKSELLLPKSSFCSSTKLKAGPVLSAAFGPNIYPPATGYDRYRFVLFLFYSRSHRKGEVVTAPCTCVAPRQRILPTPASSLPTPPNVSSSRGAVADHSGKQRSGGHVAVPPRSALARTSASRSSGHGQSTGQLRPRLRRSMARSLRAASPESSTASLGEMQTVRKKMLT